LQVIAATIQNKFFAGFYSEQKSLAQTGKCMERQVLTSTSCCMDEKILLW